MNFFTKKLHENLERNVFWCTFASVLKTASRGGAVVARWAHNPKAGGSIPSPATFEERFFLSSFCFMPAWELAHKASRKQNKKNGSPAKVGGAMQKV